MGKASRSTLQPRGIYILILITIGLYVSTWYSNLLFQTLAEMLSIIIAICAFIMAWNTRRFITSSFYPIIGISCGAVGIIDLIYTLAFKGMPFFPTFGTNLAVSLWIAARYLQSISILCAMVYGRRRINSNQMLACYVIFTSLLITLIFTGLFPTCYIEATGFTSFEIISEYVIISIFGISIGALYKLRNEFDHTILVLLVLAMIFTILSEFAFALYAGGTNAFNVVGQLSNVFAFYMIYEAIAQSSLAKPFSTLFQQYNKRELGYRKELADLGSRLTEMADAKLSAELASEAKTIFLANMSHELRTPLNVIMGFSDLLRNGLIGPISAEQRDVVQDIYQSSEHLTSLIDDLLDLSRIEAGRLDIEKTEFSLKEMLEGSVRLLRETTREHNITIQLDVPDDMRMICADKRRIKQVIINLLSNAIKYTLDGGRVGITVTDNQEEVQVTVWDTGIGISQADIGKLFVPFQRLNNTITRNLPGTGLGLNFSKKLVEMHGGRIWVESEVGIGSKFCFAIPRVAMA